MASATVIEKRPTSNPNESDDEDEVVPPTFIKELRSNRKPNQSRPYVLPPHIKVTKISSGESNPGPSVPIPVELFHCACGRSFTSSTSINQHKYCTIDMQPKPHICEEVGCGKTFYRKWYLDLHSKSHKGDHQSYEASKPLTKSTQQFQGSQASRRYVKNVFGEQDQTMEKKFTCDECGRKYSYKKSLLLHRKLHLEHRDYNCGECGASYTRKSHFDRHMNSKHTGTRPFICEPCGKGFFTKGEMLRHMKNHCAAILNLNEARHKFKNFSCTLCTNKFGSTQSLRRHMKFHTAQLFYGRFLCGICGRHFVSKQRLDRHNLLVHTGVKAETQNVSHMVKWKLLPAAASQPFMENVETLELLSKGAGWGFSDFPSSHFFTDDADGVVAESLEIPRVVRRDTNSPLVSLDSLPPFAPTLQDFFQNDPIWYQYRQVLISCSQSSQNMKHTEYDVLVETDENKYKPQINNPMLISLVLQTFFRFPDLNTLKSCRLVCKLWSKEIFPRLRQNSILVLKEVDNGDHKLSLIEYMNASNIPGDPFRLTSIPHQKYRLESFNLELREGSTLSKFFNKFGPSMKELHINKSVFKSKMDFDGIAYVLTPKLAMLCLEENRYSCQGDDVKNYISPQVNLKSLSLKLSEVDGEASVALCGGSNQRESNKNFPSSSWADMLTIFSNVQNACLQNIMFNGTRSPRHDLQNFLAIIAELQGKNGFPASLVSLDILNVVQPALQTFPLFIVTQLRELRLPLVVLSMDIGVNTRVRTLKEILEIHAHTLQKLCIFRAPYANPFPKFTFESPLDKLQKLTLIGPIFSNLWFLEFMPKLKILRRLDRVPHLSVDKPLLLLPSELPVGPFSLVENTDFEQLQYVVAPDMVEFMDGGYLCTCQDVNGLARLMPNLKCLRIGLDNTGLRAVAQNWIHLQSLDVEPYEMIKELSLQLEPPGAPSSSNSDAVEKDISNLISMLECLQLKVNGMAGDEAMKVLTWNLKQMTI